MDGAAENRTGPGDRAALRHGSAPADCTLKKDICLSNDSAWASMALLAAESGKPWKRETIIELTYRADIAGWLMIQPDIQYIQHPGMDRGTESAWLIGLRFQVNRGWSW